MFTYPGVDQPVQTSTDSHVPLVPRIVQDVASTTPIGVSKDVVRSESFILILIFLLEISRPLKIRDISTEFSENRQVGMARFISSGTSHCCFDLPS